MTEIAHQPCPYVSCASSDAFSFNTGGFGKCHACNQGYPSRREVFSWAKEKYPIKGNNEWNSMNVTNFEPRKVESQESGRFQAMRGITASTMEDYGVRTYPDRQEYVYPSGGVKVRRLDEKAFYTKDSFKGDELFGMNLFTSGASKMVTITEGELDALSVAQMLKGSYTNPVVSLPSATPSKKLWENCKPWLDGFDKIILSVDNDDAGNEVAARIAKLFPNKVYRVDHSKYKDANEFLQNGAQAEFKGAWWNARKYVPENILNTAEQFIKLYNDTPNHQYVETGIRDLDDKILGLMQGHFTVFKAPTGIGKCLHPDQGVMMWDGSIKLAKDVVDGDQLMGDDSTPRTVTGTTKGQEEMYKIIPNKGEIWVCNKSHMLSVVNTVTGVKSEISVADYLKKGETFKHEHKLYRMPVKEFGGSHKVLPFHPYLVGAYLGDGHAHRAAISLGPKKSMVMDEVVDYLESTGHHVNFEDKVSYTEVTFKKGGFWKYIKPYVYNTERYIPGQYKLASESSRAELLAGLLDTDGSCTDGGVEITQKFKTLANDIAFVSRSLGLAAYVKKKVGSIKSLGFVGQYYRVLISGDFSKVPLRRLKVKPRIMNKDVLRTGFKVEPLGVGEYAGFQLDGNHRFLLDDFTVTHNTELMRYLEYTLLKKGIPIAAWHLEETKLRSLLGLVSYELKDNLTRRDLIEEKGRGADVIDAINELTGKENFYQFYLQDGEGSDELCDQIRYFSQACGVKFVFFEPIQDVVSGSSDESKEQMLADLSVRLSKLAAELNVGIVSIGHTNDNGDFKYCRMIGQRASVIVNLSRDKDATDMKERNTTHLHVEKNRPTGEVGQAGKMMFNTDTFTLREVI